MGKTLSRACWKSMKSLSSPAEDWLAEAASAVTVTLDRHASGNRGRLILATRCHRRLAHNLVSILRRAGTADPSEHPRKMLLRFESACDGDIQNTRLSLAQHLLRTLYSVA